MSGCCSCMLPQPSVCRTQITSADLAELLYIQGLDVNLCEKFAPIANILQFRDCLGNIISANSQIVTCAQYANQLCDTLATLASGGAVTLGVTQVVGADCQTYVIPETPFTAIDTTTIDFTTSGAFGHTLTGVVRVSIDAGNILEVRPNGLYVPTPASACSQISTFPAGAPVVLGSTPVVGVDCQTHVIPATPPTVIGVADTNCINLSVTGAPGSQVITADPIISPSAGNILQCTLNGLSVNVCAHLAGLTNVGPAIPGQTFLVGKDCNAYTIPVSPGETPITVIDTSCINLSTSGVANHTIQADVVVSAQPGNILQCTALGLFVPNTAVDVDIQVVDTACLNLSIVEAPVGTFTISGTPTISPVPGNALSCTAQGLFVPVASVPFSVADTQCINLDLTASVLTATPIISPQSNNTLECIASGLIAPETIITGLDTNCIDTVVEQLGQNNYRISSNPILSTTYPGYGTPCNSLQCTATGLAAPPDIDGNVGTIIGQLVADLDVPEGGANSQLDVTLNIVNPSSCRSATLHITHRVAEINVGNAAGAAGNFIINTQAVHSFNLPGVLVTGPFVLTSGQMNDTSSPATSLPGTDWRASDISFDFIVPPGFVGTYTGRSQYNVQQAASNITSITMQPTILSYVLNTI